MNSHGFMCGYNKLVEQMLQRGMTTAHDLASIESCILTTNQAPIFTLLDKFPFVKNKLTKKLFEDFALKVI